MANGPMENQKRKQNQRHVAGHGTAIQEGLNTPSDGF